MLKKMFHNLCRDLKEWREFRDAKVHIVSFPKCGRTWLRVLVGKAICLKYGLDDRTLIETLPLTKAAGVLPTFFTHDGSESPKERRFDQLRADGGRYRRKKVVFLIREPRDAAVSCYFQDTKRKIVFEGSLSEYIRHDCYGLRKILSFYRIWERNRKAPEAFLLLRYEDMKRDPVAALRTVLAFMGVDSIEEEILQEAVQFSSFENMRKLEAEAYFESKRLRPRKRKDEDSYKVRRGKVGGFVDYFSPEDHEYVKQVFAEVGCPYYSID